MELLILLAQEGSNPWGIQDWLALAKDGGGALLAWYLLLKVVPDSQKKCDEAQDKFDERMDKVLSTFDVIMQKERDAHKSEIQNIIDEHNKNIERLEKAWGKQ